MIYGVTGTREGMTFAQRKSFIDFVESHEIVAFHHGDCVGVDDEAATIVSSLSPLTAIVCHPPIDEKLRAFNTKHSQIREPKTHFARNREIVDSASIVLVVPKDPKRQSRGGTWYTHDYAIKKGKKVVIFWPDGTILKS